MKTLAISCLTIVAVAFSTPIIAKADADDEAAKRAEALQAHVKTFRLDLSYFGDMDKPFYRLVLSVPKINQTQASQFDRCVQITEENALKIIDQLAKNGYLEQAKNPKDLKSTKFFDEVKQFREPHYRMEVSAGDLILTEVLDLWELPIYRRFDELRTVLDGEAAKSMDFLMGRISGFRRLVEEQADALNAVISMDEWPGLVPRNDDLGDGAGRIMTRVRFVVHPDGTYRFNQTTGTLPREAIKHLREQIEMADVGPGVEDASTITFRWLDEAEKRHEKVFTNPDAADRTKLVATLEDIAKKNRCQPPPNVRPKGLGDGVKAEENLIGDLHSPDGTKRTFGSSISLCRLSTESRFASKYSSMVRTRQSVWSRRSDRCRNQPNERETANNRPRSQFALATPKLDLSPFISPYR